MPSVNEPAANDPSAAAGNVSADEVALRALGASEGEPLGAWRLAEILRDAGIDVSEATAGRLLRDLDTRGFARREGNRGRHLTEAGQVHLERLALRRRIDDWNDRLHSAVDTRDLQQLLDLFHLRRALERESARLAASRMTDDDRVLLNRIIARQREAHEVSEETWVDGWSFHAAVARASHSPLLDSLFRMLEDAAEQGLGALSHELIHPAAGEDLVRDHLAIAEALDAGDADAAESAMLRHLDVMIEALEKLARRGAAPDDRDAAG